MKNRDILDCMNYVDADLIEAAERQPVKNPRLSLPRRWIAAAACLVLIIGSGFGVRAYAAEQREYRAAVTFFAENDLPTEGLTRGEIKAVYRDITTKQFTYEKTAEVLQNSLQEQIPGYEMVQKAPAPEETQRLWAAYQANKVHFSSPDQEYRIRAVETTDPDTGIPVFQKSIVSRYENGECLWQTEISAIDIRQCQKLSHGLLVWGCAPKPDHRAAIAKLDPEGKLLWVQILNNDSDEFISTVIENPDGNIAVFSQGDLKYFYVSQYGADGQRLSFRKHPSGGYDLRNAVRLGEDYLVQLTNWYGSDQDKLVRITRDGEMTDSFCYTEDDQDYHIVDMQEFNGNLYISAYTTPPKTNDHYTELFPIITDHDDLMAMSEAELTNLIRASYQAVLLICDPLDGTPQQFYTVPGNLAGELRADKNEHLIWQTEDIQAVGYSPATSAFIFYGTSEQLEYTFAPNGILESRTETGEMVPFWK